MPTSRPQDKRNANAASLPSELNSNRFEVSHVHKVECVVPWLNDTLVFFTISLQLCQQLKDKVSVHPEVSRSVGAVGSVSCVPRRPVESCAWSSFTRLASNRCVCFSFNRSPSSLVSGTTDLSNPPPSRPIELTARAFVSTFASRESK